MHWDRLQISGLDPDSIKNKDLSRVKNSLNAILPDDISITGIGKCRNDFHSRYSAKKRVYIYNFSTRKSAVLHDFTYRLKTKFDIDLAKDYCKLLVGNNDFRNYCKNKMISMVSGRLYIMQKP